MPIACKILNLLVQRPFLIATVYLMAWVPALSQQIEWEQTYGGMPQDHGVRIIQTPDSGFAFLGRTFSFAEGEDDYYLLRLNQNGDTIWTKTYGGTAGVGPNDIINTYDGGFLICGTNSNFGTDSTFYVLKVNEIGEEEWVASPGYRGRAHSVVQTADSGYVLAGFSRDNISNNLLAFIVKLTQQGDSLWAHLFSAGPEVVCYL